MGAKPMGMQTPANFGRLTLPRREKGEHPNPSLANSDQSSLSMMPWKRCPKTDIFERHSRPGPIVLAQVIDLPRWLILIAIRVQENLGQ